MIHHIKTEMAKFPDHSLEYQIYSIFARQPTLIGTGIGNLRPLNLKDDADWNVYYRSVQREFKTILDGLGFISKPSAQLIFNDAIEKVQRND